MADDYEDISGVYDPVADPASEDVDLDTAITDKVKAAMLANEAMKREEAALERDYRSGTGSGVLLPNQPRPSLTPGEYAQGSVLPTSKGFMYLGGAPVAPPVGPENYDRMVAGGFIQPAPERIKPWDRAADLMPGYQQFAAQQDLASAIKSGVPQETAFSMYGPALLGSRQMTGNALFPRRYNVAGVGLVDASGRVLAPQHQVSAHNVPGVGLVDAQTGRVIAGSKASDPATLAQVKALTTAITRMQGDVASGMVKAEVGNPQIAEWRRELSELQGKGSTATTVTGTANAPERVTPPTDRTSGRETRIRVKNPQGKIGTIPANQLEEALAAGWTRM